MFHLKPLMQKKNWKIVVSIVNSIGCRLPAALLMMEEHSFIAGAAFYPELRALDEYIQENFPKVCRQRVNAFADLSSKAK